MTHGSRLEDGWGPGPGPGAAMGGGGLGSDGPPPGQGLGLGPQPSVTHEPLTINNFSINWWNISEYVGSGSTIQYHLISSNTITCHPIHPIPSNTIQFHPIPCNTIQYHPIPSNTMQYHLVSTSGYHPFVLLFYGSRYLWMISKRYLMLPICLHKVTVVWGSRNSSPHTVTKSGPMEHKMHQRISLWCFVLIGFVSVS